MCSLLVKGGEEVSRWCNFGGQNTLLAQIEVEKRCLHGTKWHHPTSGGTSLLRDAKRNRCGFLALSVLFMKVAMESFLHWGQIFK